MPAALAVSVLAPVVWSAPASGLAFGTSYRSGRTFSAVSCPAPRDCTAVGFDATALVPIVATERDGVWGSAVVMLASPFNAVFTGVSCLSLGSCTAVGYSYEGVDNHDVPQVYTPIVATETGGRWHQVLGVATGATGSGFLAVSCTSTGNCTAVGGSEPGFAFSGPGPIVATETNGTWSAPTVVPTTTGLGFFAGVSCAAPRTCAAVGGDEVTDYYGGYDANAPIAASETGGAWGPASEVDVPGAALSAVSCPSPTACTAVGGQLPQGGGAFAVAESGGAWGAPQAIAAPPAYASLTAVSCRSAGTCTAVGDVDDQRVGGLSSQTLRATETAGTWRPAVVGGGGTTAGVSCWSTAGCTAVGAFGVCLEVPGVTCTGPSADTYPIYATEPLGAWPTPRAPRHVAASARNGAVAVTWSPSRSRTGQGITGYTATAVAGAHEFACTARGTSCTIQGLVDGTAYTISVLTRTTVGSSAPSAPRTATPRS